MKHFINLTNGIEAIKEYKLTDYSFIRIQSTTIERKDWIKLLGDLDHNFLVNLALGEECKVYDYGTNRKFSKTIYYGLPLIEFCLNRYWYSYESPAYRYTRQGVLMSDTETSFQHIYNELFVYNSTKDKEKLKTKLKYYKKFLNSNKINLIGISSSTTNDGRYEFYTSILKNKQMC